MRRRMILLATLAMLGTMLAAPSAVAKPSPTASGAWLSLLYETPERYPANEAFHVKHGMGRGTGQSFFALYVDGLLQTHGQLYRGEKGEFAGGGVYLYDFPVGLSAGDHKFEGVWYGACKYTPGYNPGIPGLCSSPNEFVEVLREVHTVTFVDRCEYFAPGADLSGCVLWLADLTGADLTGADLTGADLAGADLTGADLTRADLTGASLFGGDLTGADLTGVVWWDTTCPDGTNTNSNSTQDIGDCDGIHRTP